MKDYNAKLARLKKLADDSRDNPLAKFSSKDLADELTRRGWICQNIAIPELGDLGSIKFDF